MILLTVSDIESPLVYSPQIKQRFKDIDLAIGCGDLSYYYLEYIISSLDIPLYFVRGNHAREVEYSLAGTRTAPWGAIDLHKKVVYDRQTNLILAGIQGSLRYNRGAYQYTQRQMLFFVLQLVPALIFNKIRHGRFLDIFVTHAPPWGIHDDDDPAHQGVKAFKWFIRIFKPTFHFHGHIHIYRPDIVRETVLGKTQIVNTYGFRKISFNN